MSPTDLLETLEAEGVSVSLNLKVSADTKPSDDTRALIRDNRDTLLEHLIAQANGKRVSHLEADVRSEAHSEHPPNVAHVQHLQADVNHGLHVDMSQRNDKLERPSKNTHRYSLQLHGDLLLNLMLWSAQHQELRIHHPNGLTLAAKPEHVRDALELHTWGLVYDTERRVLVSWGAVPTSALLDKRDLATDEPLVNETRVA